MDHFCNSLFLKMDLKKLRKKIVFVDFQKFSNFFRNFFFQFFFKIDNFYFLIIEQKNFSKNIIKKII